MSLESPGPSSGTSPSSGLPSKGADITSDGFLNIPGAGTFKITPYIPGAALKGFEGKSLDEVFKGFGSLNSGAQKAANVMKAVLIKFTKVWVKQSGLINKLKDAECADITRGCTEIESSKESDKKVGHTDQVKKSFDAMIGEAKKAMQKFNQVIGGGPSLNIHRTGKSGKPVKSGNPEKLILSSISPSSASSISIEEEASSITKPMTPLKEVGSLFSEVIKEKNAGVIEGPNFKNLSSSVSFYVNSFCKQKGSFDEKEAIKKVKLLLPKNPKDKDVDMLNAMLLIANKNSSFNKEEKERVALLYGAVLVSKIRIKYEGDGSKEETKMSIKAILMFTFNKCKVDATFKAGVHKFLKECLIELNKRSDFKEESSYIEDVIIDALTFLKTIT